MFIIQKMWGASMNKTMASKLNKLRTCKVRSMVIKLESWKRPGDQRPAETNES